MLLRNYLPSDFLAVKAIHEKTQIDYAFPDIDSPLFIVTKVIVDESGIVRACGGAYIQVETYLWMDPGEWADASDKLAAIHALDGAVLHDTYLKGVDEAVLYLPPGMDRFGERLVEMGWRPNRDGWICYHKRLKR